MMINEIPVNSTDPIRADTAPAPVMPDEIPKKKNNFPRLVGILVLMVVVTVFTFYKFTKGNSKIQPIPLPSETSAKDGDPTATWKTYTNGNYNYQFKYPLDWPDIPPVVSNQKDGFQLAGQNVYLSQYFPQVKPPQLQIEVFKSNKELRPDELEEKESCGFPTFAISKSKVDGIQAIVGRRLAPRDTSAPYYTGLHYCIRTYSGGFIYNFLWEEGADVDSGLFDQILSTFKFVDQTVSQDEWKTYMNTKLGFKIDYPKVTGATAEKWVFEEMESKGVLTGYWVGFGTTASKSGGYIWGVSIYNDGNIENLIKQMGSQFSDRIESRKQITVNGIPAMLVTVTTGQIPSWIFKTVYIQREGKVFSISNGATDIPEFDKFYNSLKFTN